jgi:N-methylhydantoinase A
VEAPIYAGNDLTRGDRVPGPAVVEYDGNTIVIHPGQAIDVDDFGNLVFSPAAKSP